MRRSRVESGRRTLAERPMGTARVVVRDALGEHGFEMAAAEDEHPVEALAPQGADHALTDGVRPGCPDWALYDPDAVGSKDGVERSGELGVAVADKELERACLVGERHREVAGLLGRPVGRRVGGHAGDSYDTRLVVDEHEDVEPAEKDRVDM